MSKYPDFEKTCGLGSVTGIGGANCRHSYWAFIEGVMERTYSDEELANIDPPPFEFEGREYTRYEATQKQREIERTVRKLRRRRAAFRAAGLEEDALTTSIRLNRLEDEYHRFSKAAGLLEQRDRMNVEYVDQGAMTEAENQKEKREENAAGQLKNAAGKPIIEVEHVSLKAAPNSITQRTNAKGGADRNFYDAEGKQVLQISNNGHGHKKEEAIGQHGEHAHDYVWTDKGHVRGEPRELTEQERRDNGDFL